MGDYICHHGIKGQKHGRRRYQYEDGSLTPAGRIRYLGPGSNDSQRRLALPSGVKDGTVESDRGTKYRAKRSENKKTEYVDTEGYTVNPQNDSKSKKHDSKWKNERTDDAQDAEYEPVPKKAKHDSKWKNERTDDAQDAEYEPVHSTKAVEKEKDRSDKGGFDAAAVKGAASTAKALSDISKKSIEEKRKHKPRMDLSDMSDEDLRKAINRECIERKYNELFAPDNVSSGQLKVDRILATTAGTLAVAGSAIEIAQKLGMIDNRDRKK